MERIRRCVPAPACSFPRSNSISDGGGSLGMNPKYVLDNFQIAPKKSLGQNFLHDPNALEKIVESADLMPGDTVLEIGPGTGALTEVLARFAARVITVEIDRRLEPILRERLEPYAHVE